MSDQSRKTANIETIASFKSMIPLRADHRKLLSQLNGGANQAEFTKEVTAFILRAAKTGRLLDVAEDRRTAQSLLDYWAEVLQRFGSAAPDATLAAFDRTSVTELAALECPYLGLHEFEEQDHRLFYGRRQLTYYLIRRLNDNRLLALVGPSGIGKTSLVMAGLLPSLRDGALEGSQDWRFCLPVVPGSNPLANLVQALYGSNVVDLDTLTTRTRQLRREPSAILEFLGEVPGKPAVVFVDQFEEIFTLCSDEEVRQAFANCLMAIVRSTVTNHRVIVNLRSDFESKIATLSDFKEKFDEARVQVTPMSIGELRDAIIQPAQLVGLQIDSRVVEAVANNVLGEQSALPLLQFTLRKLWEDRDPESNQITWQKYEVIRAGRVALCNAAEQLYKQIKKESADETAALKKILVSMVEFDQTLTAVSRLTLVRDLFALDSDRDLIDRVFKRLVQSGLVRMKRGSTPDDDQIELAHEALIQDWRLRQWSEVKREPVALRQLLGVAVRDWVSQDKNDESALYTGTQLARVIEAHFKGLTPDADSRRPRV